ncbi:hypothetical protein V1517DRAFT_18454 [Lipomyces orientalis]|uniref:Uncharacterized protein n=1 Tax=Lipomyces orientalis TaxID=1233043 RepID=A0ACC3TGA8_9ASCO
MIDWLILALLILPFTAATPGSTSFTVPSILTPHFEVSPPYHVTPRNVDFTVASVSNWGTLHDYSIDSSYIIRRQGPLTLSFIQNRTFWFAGPTSIFDTVKRTGKSSSTSVAMALNLAHPSWIREVSTTPVSSWPVVPLTPAEKEIRRVYRYDFRFSTQAHSSLINDTSAIQFWDVTAYNNDGCEETAGSTLIIYTFDKTKNTLIVTRPAPVYQTLSPLRYPYGSFATLAVGGTTYLYAWDPFSTGDEFNDGWRKDIHVASAPSSSIADKSTWKYYDGHAGTWSATEPLPTARRQSQAIFTLSDPPFEDLFAYFLVGSIFYSEYHNAYLLIYSSTVDYRYVRVRYSSTPVGPWSSPSKIIFDSANYEGVAIRNSLATATFFQTNGNLGGKSILLPVTKGDDVLTFKVNFA